MKYDFTSIIDRRGKDALAIEGVGTDPGINPDPPKEGFDIIPMWIADMNFPTVPAFPKPLSTGQNIQHMAILIRLTNTTVP